MAEQFLTLMADLDEDSQALMSSWSDRLKRAGFIGTQTPGLPYHISLAAFALDKEEEAVCEMQRLAAEFSAMPVYISHIGMFPGGRVLFAAPDMNTPDLLAMRKAISVETFDRFPWTPHSTLLIDEPQTVCRALPVLAESFRPFVGSVTRLHLCAFWPAREIMTIELSRN